MPFSFSFGRFCLTRLIIAGTERRKIKRRGCEDTRDEGEGEANWEINSIYCGKFTKNLINLQKME